jgi:hypothetical protein
VPPLVVAGEPFAVTVSVLTLTGERDTSAVGTVTLMPSAWSITPTTLELAAGVVTTEAVLVGAHGAVEITARWGERRGTAAVGMVALASLPGNPGDLASPAIPPFPYVPDGAGFTRDHPSLPGLPIAHDQVMVALAPSATVSAINEALARTGALIVGGFGGPAGSSGTLFLRLPATSHADAAPLLSLLAADAAVDHVAPDVVVGPTGPAARQWRHAGDLDLVGGAGRR